MLAQIRTIPPPKLSIQSIFGQNSRTDFETSKSMWECDRIGNARPGPRLYEPGLTAASTLYDVPNYWEDDKASSASSKNSLTTRTQHMEISMDELRVKQPFFPPNQSPHAESLLADYRTWSNTTVTATSTRTIMPSCRANPRRLTKSKPWRTIAHPKMFKTLCPRLADSELIVPAE